MNIKEIKDGIMNFVRQMGSSDRRARDINLKPVFDFDGWIDALETSASANSTQAPREQLPHNMLDATEFLLGPADHDLEVLGFVNSPSGFLCFDGFAGMAFMSEGNSTARADAWIDGVLE
jgi:hypothetical protein